MAYFSGERNTYDSENNLLKQVLTVHHNGRPDIFKSNAKKYTDNQLLEIIADDFRPIFVCVDESDNVLGYAFCIFIQHKNDNILTDIKTLYIDDLCVDEKYRGQGLGSQLYRYVVDYAKNNCMYNVTLNVWALNESALKFYQKCGLQIQKIGMEHILKN